jgi:hypothetical protein
MRVRVSPKLGVVGAVASLLLGVAPALAGTFTPHLEPGATLAGLAHSVAGPEAQPGDPRLAYLAKLDSHLQDVALNRGDGQAVALAADREGVTRAPGGVEVDVYVRGDLAAAQARLRALGMQITAVSDLAAEHVVEGTLPAAALTRAAALPEAHAIMPVIAPVIETGSVLSQGDAAIHGPTARALGPQGLGATVGIISDSIGAVGGGVSDSQASGDLPANVTVLKDDPAGTDEGRAMAEIVHDEAPLAGIAFSTGDGGPAAKAEAIDSFAGRVDVIADDVVYPGEPYFQDDAIAQAVDRARARGTAYFAAAGNQRGNAWEGIYTPTADPRGASATTEDFDPGPGVDTVQTVGTIAANGHASIGVQWAEPWGGATTDLAVDVYEIVGGVPAYDFTEDTDNLATGIPEEFVSFSNGAAAAQFGIAIRRVAGTGTPRIKYIGFGDTSYAIERGSNTGAIGPDAASARGSLAVAASRYTTPSTPEGFSSPGPVVHYFDARGGPLGAPEQRQKPNLAAPDGVSTAVPGFATFYGTSAAAPAAAGEAALMLGARQDLPIDELYAIMSNPANSFACVGGSPLVDCGGGFLLADRALIQSQDSTPPVVSSTASPATPDGANGWYQGAVQVTWNVSDSGSPIGTAVGCDPLAPADSATTFTCTATSAGGTTSSSVEIRRDSTPPTPPAITGVTAGVSYAAAKLPAASAIACTASDPTSGVGGCTVTGYSDAPGQHILTATATNGAGLISTSTLVYAVSPAALPAAISGLRSATGLTLRRLVRTGMTVSVAVASAGTKLSLSLVAKVPKTKGRKARTFALASLRKRSGPGTAELHLVLARKARRHLSGVGRATVTVTVRASAAGTKATRLVRSRVLRG